ncbi:MAG: 1-phosphofructokinase family hexose kinase [Pyramidobacter sp.]|nr:1-phosphofructokinase family hexose kinase [Pyramidobacter sp.]
MIVTVTLNPAVDEEYELPEFRVGEFSRAASSQRTAGGKGINVALMLAQLGYSAAAMGFLAGFNGEYIRDALRRQNVTTNFVHVQGETRTNVYIADSKNGSGTRIAEKGPVIDEDALKRFMTSYRRMINRASAVVIGGSLPGGVPFDFYKSLCLIARQAGLPVFIDANGDAFLSALDALPNFVKIPDDMIGVLAGTSGDSLEAAVAAVKNVRSRGIPWAAASYRVYGDVFATPDGVFLTTADVQGDSASLFTAADALVAGIVVAEAEGMRTEGSIRFSMACAMENASHVLKGVGGREAVERFLNRVRVERID